MPVAAVQGMAVVAVFNSNEDTVEVLRMALEAEGFETVAAHVPDIQRGRVDILTFIERHRPAAIVYDVPPPYEWGWTFLRLLRSTPVFREMPVIVTTTNKRALEELVGPTDAIEILGKPYELDHLVQAVRKAVPPVSGRAP